MISERVARGVALLDRVEPGWFHRIDVNALDVSQYDRCILGQLYKDYRLGLSALGLTQDEATEHGFQTRIFKTDDILSLILSMANATSDYPALTQEWRRVIEILRQETATEVTVEEKELALV